MKSFLDLRVGHLVCEQAEKNNELTFMILIWQNVKNLYGHILMLRTSLTIKSFQKHGPEVEAHHRLMLVLFVL